MPYYTCDDCGRAFSAVTNAQNHFCWCLKEVLESPQINWYCFTEKLATPKKAEIEKRIEFVPIELTPKVKKIRTES